MKIKCNDRRFVYRFVGKDAEKFAKVTAENLRKMLRGGEFVEQRKDVVEIKSNHALLYQVQECVRKTVPFEANGLYILRLLSCTYVFKGYHSEQCVHEIWDLAKEYPGIFADAKGGSIILSTDSGDEEYLHNSAMECIKKVLGDEYEWR